MCLWNFRFFFFVLAFEDLPFNNVIYLFCNYNEHKFFPFSGFSVLTFLYKHIIFCQHLLATGDLMNTFILLWNIIYLKHTYLVKWGYRLCSKLELLSKSFWILIFWIALKKWICYVFHNVSFNFYFYIYVPYLLF